MNNMRSYLDILTEAPARGLSSTGGLVNFNVDKSLPVTKIKDKDGNTFDLHAAEDEAQKFIDGSNAYEKFDASTAAPQAGGNKELDAIVAKYAKSGMTLDDVAKMEQEAGSDSNARYVLAYAAKTLGLEGMYRADGSGFIFMKDGQPSGARGASLGQSQDLAKIKLLPQPIVDKMQKVADGKKEGDPDKEKFQQAVNDQTGEDPVADMDGEGGAAGAVAQKLKRVQELLAKAIEQTTEESWAPRSYADQLLEEISAQETTELQGLIKELETELPNIADESIKQQIEAALNQYKEFQAKSTQGIDEPGAEGGVQIDTDSDSAIAAAIKDPALWITNEMPKELAQANAKGLLKATENGKKKSASAAAVQQIMKQIASITGNKDMDIDADGLYGPASVAAVKKAQELAGITVDGDPGADTAAELVKFSKDPTGKGGIADTDLTQDLDGAIELLKKGIAAFGGEQPAAQAGGDAGRVGSTDPAKANPPGQPITTSIDFSMRNMLETLERLDEKLSPEDEETLKGIIGELQPKLDDPEYQASLDPEMQAKFTELTKLRAEYNKLVTDGQAAAGAAQDAIAGKLLKAVKGMGTDEEAVYAAVAEIADKASFDKMLTANPELIPTVLDDFSGAELQKVIDGFAAKGIKIEVVKEPRGLTSGTYKYDGKTYGVGAGKEDPKAQAGADPNKLANPTGNPEQPAVATPTPRPPNPAQAGINSSKDYGMKKPINESASMNISMSGDNAGEVSELLNMLKNAGMPNAAPVGAIDMPMDMPVKAIPGGAGIDLDRDGRDDMEVGPPDMPDESPCGSDEGGMGDMKKLAGLKGPMPEEDVEEDGWDNSPDEEYKDDNTMYQSGGLGKPKKAYPAAQDGDNPMAVESVKERLWAALQEKTANEGDKKRGKKMKLKASRGNEDIKTTEGRGKGRGKKSRG
ncbi:MAG: hypothetical protein CMN33_02605 [Saprospirales bacterium]|nr:hypothetical protein [Saprospirales bacterium]